MKTHSKTQNENKPQQALAQINAQIADLQNQRIALAQPLKDRYVEAVKELGEMAGQIRELDPSWKPISHRPKADAKIVEILTASEKPMTADEIIAAVGDAFSKWKVKSTLKKQSTGLKSRLSVNDGRYSVKAAA